MPTATSSLIRTNIVLDKKLVARAKRQLKVTSAREAVHVALKQLVTPRDYSALQALAGDAPAKGYDPKAAYLPKAARHEK